jgi:hypothetical protein
MSAANAKAAAKAANVGAKRGAPRLRPSDREPVPIARIMSGMHCPCPEPDVCHPSPAGGEGQRARQVPSNQTARRSSAEDGRGTDR